jgi:hypothetical protein
MIEHGKINKILKIYQKLFNIKNSLQFTEP